MAEYIEREALEIVATAVNKLIFDLRTNMTSVSRYVRDSQEKHPTLTVGEFVDRNLKYKRLAEQAVDNILLCLDRNEYLRRAECLEALARQAKSTSADVAPVVHARWDIRDNPGYFDTYGRPDQSAHCTYCGFSWNDLYSVKNYFKRCPNCGAIMDLEG